MKTLKLLPLFLLLSASQSTTTETNDISKANATTYPAADSMEKWTRNINAHQSNSGDAINFTDANQQKQGKWVTIENDKIVRTEYFKNGKLIDQPK